MKYLLHQTMCLLTLCSALLMASQASAEQKLEFDGYELHYVVIPTRFLTAEVANRYGVTRGKGRALVNLSLLKDGSGVVADSLSGRVKNLMSQQQTLDFEEVIEGDAIYYIAQLQHSDRDTLLFEVELSAPGTGPRTLSFRQKLYTDGTTVE
ncbi:MAG: DUF4426 domain-containing protein [Pseudomonadales bacterium]